MEVADAIAQNDTLLRLNLQFDTLGPRVRVTEKLKQNLDACKIRSLLFVACTVFFSLVRRQRMSNRQ